MKIRRYYFPTSSKIAVLADIHNTEFDISMLEKEKPDIILIPGDMCSSHLCKKGYDMGKESTDIKGKVWYEPRFALKLLKILPKIAPTYYTRGNHEFYWNEADMEVFAQNDIVMLDREYVKVRGLLIGGVASISRYTPQPEDKVREAIDFLLKYEKEEGKKILLLHEPHLFYKYGILSMNIDLTISGHAHGGQWRIFGRGAIAPGQGFFPKYIRGIYDDKLLVSAGMSNTVPIIPRFFNPTEIIVLSGEGNGNKNR